MAFSTSGYGTAGARTQTKGKTAALAWGDTTRGRTNTSSAPHTDNLSGRTALADTRSGELGNDRTQTEIDRLKQEMAMRERSASSTDTIRDLLLKQFGGAPGGGVGEVAAPMPIGPAPIPAPMPPGTPDVGDQAFARAKDRSGLSLQSGLRTLKGVMQRRGQAGSSIERDATTGLIGGELGRMAGVDLEGAEADQRRGYELEDRAAGDVWRGREFAGREREAAERTRNSGLEMLLRLMSQGGRAY